jgi:hypothetical protein
MMLSVAAVVAGALALPGIAGAQAPNEDSVVAYGFETGTLRLDIDVRSGPSGENPTGRVSFHLGGGLGPTYTANASCLAVNGNTAVVGFVGTVDFSGTTDPVAGLIRLTDAGGPGSGQDVFEFPQSVFVPTPPTATPDCSHFPPTALFTRQVFTFGPYDIVVTDAPAAPTSKDQCKNGGWKTYGVFKNQGDCVSFVVTKSKNPPALGNP